MMGLTVTVILVVIVIATVWTLYQTQQALTTVTDDTFTASNGTCVRVTNDCIAELTNVENGSDASAKTGNFSLCGTADDYYGLLMSPAGDNAIDGQTMNATYIERNCNRLTGMTATITSYLTLLMAVVLLAYVAVAKI